MKFAIRSAVPNCIAKLLRNACDLRLFLLLVALAYALAYLGHGAAPGNNPQYPLGWWGWFDQGNYLNAAQAFAAFDFSPGRYFYPPFYPLLGAFFLRASAMHPFWLIDLICLLWFAWTFAHFARRHVPQWMALLIFLLTIVASRTLFENFVIPWTSTLSTALLSVGIHTLDRFAGGAEGDAASPQPSTWTIAVCSLALGLLAVVRPVDALVGGVLWLGVLTSAWKSCAADGRPFPRTLLIALLAITVGPLLFFSFNQWLFGSPFGSYLRAGTANGYFPADSAEKFVSIFLDGYTLYLEPRSGLLDHYPWLALALPALVFVLVRGDWALRVVAAAVCAQFALYLPYGDLLPNGLWRYLNIHYFKWTFPYLALFACYAGLATFRLLRAKPAQGLTRLALFAAAALLLASLRTEVSMQPLQIHLATSPNSAPAATTKELVMAASGGDINLIDLDGLQGGFTEVYFGEHGLSVDGRELLRVRDYRVLPAPWGVRILFIRPVRGQSIVFRPDQRLNMDRRTLNAGSGNYHFILGRPKPFWNEANAIPAAVYPLGTLIEFSSAGKGAAYASEGWSTPEAWGRWSTGTQASLRFKLLPPAAAVNVELLLAAYVNSRHPEQRVDIEANGKLVKRLVFSAAAAGSDPRRENFTVPLGTDVELKLVLRTPDAASPAKLGLSADSRTLGVGLISLTITP